MSDAPLAPAVLELDGVVRRFEQGGRTLEVLNGASLTITAGEVVAMVGPSGSGKSTLLHVAGLLERPDAGKSRSQERRAAASAIATAPRCAGAPWVSSISSIICCRNSPPSRMS